MSSTKTSHVIVSTQTIELTHNVVLPIPSTRSFETRNKHNVLMVIADPDPSARRARTVIADPGPSARRARTVRADPGPSAMPLRMWECLT